MTGPGDWRLPAPPEVRVVHVEFVMGTAVSFDVRVEGSRDDEARSAIGEAVEWLHWVDRTFTTYDETSYVRRLARNDLELQACPAEVATVVQMCADYKARTGGWFDALAGTERFDPSGVVKGWAVQRASDLLVERGFDRHCVNGGGDIVARGRPGDAERWGIGIIDPFDAHRLRLAVRLRDEVVATSGIAERGHHIWTPDGRAADELASVTVVGTDLTETDVFATAAFAMGAVCRDWLAASGFDAYVIDAAGVEWMTDGFAARAERLAAG